MTLRNKLYVSAAIGSVMMVILELMGLGHQYFVLSWCKTAEQENCWYYVKPLYMRLILGTLTAYFTWQLLQLYVNLKKLYFSHIN